MISTEELAKLKRTYHRDKGVIVPHEVRIISNLLDEIERLNREIMED